MHSLLGLLMVVIISTTVYTSASRNYKYSVHPKCINFGKTKQYIKAYYCFAYYRKQLRTNNTENRNLVALERKYIKNEALAISRAAIKNKDTELAKVAIEKCKAIIRYYRNQTNYDEATNSESESQKMQKEIVKLDNFLVATSAGNTEINGGMASEEEPHPLDKNNDNIDPKSRIPDRHPLTSKFIDRVDYYDLLQGHRCNNNNDKKQDEDNSNILTNYLKNRDQPVIVTNSPITKWKLYEKISWEYLEFNLPEILRGIRFTKSRFNLYRTNVPGNETKDLPVTDFFDLLHFAEAGYQQEGKKGMHGDKEPVLYPYFSGTLPNDVQVEREMYIDLLNASICEVIAGGNKHCGTYAISNILSLCFYSA
jgi:hypothetical protein